MQGPLAQKSCSVSPSTVLVPLLTIRTGWLLILNIAVGHGLLHAYRGRCVAVLSLLKNSNMWVCVCLLRTCKRSQASTVGHPACTIQCHNHKMKYKLYKFNWDGLSSNNYTPTCSTAKSLHSFRICIQDDHIFHAQQKLGCSYPQRDFSTSTCFMHPSSTTHLTRHSQLTKCRDGVKVLWCHSHLVWLVFEGSIPICMSSCRLHLHGNVYNQKNIISQSWVYTATEKTITKMQTGCKVKGETGLQVDTKNGKMLLIYKCKGHVTIAFSCRFRGIYTNGI